jgi:hypothetical protein
MSKIKWQSTCKSKLTIFFHTQNNNLFDLELSENMEPLLSSMQNLSFSTTSFKRTWWNSITDYGRALELTLLETQHIGLPSCVLFGQTNIIKCFQYNIGIRTKSWNWTKPSILVSMTSLMDPKTIIGLFPKGLLLLICVEMWDLYLSISWNYLNTLVDTTYLVCLLYSLFYPLIQPIGHLLSCLHLLVLKSVQWKYICWYHCPMGWNIGEVLVHIC